MRVFSMVIAGIVIAAAIPAAFAANQPASSNKGMSRTDAFNVCRQQGFNRPEAMRQCVIAKMRGQE